MFGRALIATSLLVSATLANAGGGALYTATDANGTVERVVETRALSNGMLGAIVSFTRQDGSRTFLEYAIRCEPMAFAYLGMTNDNSARVPNLRLVRVESDRMLGNTVRPVSLVEMGDDPFNAETRALAEALCS